MKIRPLAWQVYGSAGTFGHYIIYYRLWVSGNLLSIMLPLEFIKEKFINLSRVGIYNEYKYQTLVASIFRNSDLSLEEIDIAMDMLKSISKDAN